MQALLFSGPSFVLQAPKNNKMYSKIGEGGRRGRKEFPMLGAPQGHQVLPSVQYLGPE